MKTLRLYWPGSADPGIETGYDWALLDAAARCHDSGYGPASAWPAAERVELILAAGGTLFTEVALPAKLRQPDDKLIGYALEDALATDPSANLYSLGDAAGEGRHAVALTAAAPLRRAVAALKAAGRGVDVIVPEEALLPAPAPGEADVAATRDAWLLRVPGQRALAVPFVPALAEPLFANAFGATPPPLTFCGDVGDWPFAVRWPAAGAPAYDWRSAKPVLPFDFARGEFAPRKRGEWHEPVLRAARWLAIAALACAALSLAELSWLTWQQKSLKSQIAGLASPIVGRQALPPGGTLPALVRSVDRLRLERGDAARLSPLPALAALADAGVGPSFSRVEAGDGRVSVWVASVDAAQFARWRDALATRHYRLQQSQDGGAARLTARWEP
ncbi:type II secretion system protein GspL [Crenobacter cavernae]|uniref:GspL cytoplasmic actin-ATPase-like domain-containing protein n=1 Tax=Crenobacter cavernae TaxID=2290923 RepID=A0ABY0FEJ4_9NEIS|nr:type II secretion system protein GspL [Crenobacter cavernae]RXZ43220.1 hypothetical protein EBB06_10665 [Crenobacter cavernae]